MKLSDLRKAGILPKGTKRERGTMNANERAYNGYLAVRKGAGEILWYAFEPFKLRLADNTTYTPDFLVMFACGALECHDCKGFKRKPSGDPGYWCEEDAKVKIKIAAELFPFVFKIVFKCGNFWIEEEI